MIQIYFIKLAEADTEHEQIKVSLNTCCKLGHQKIKGNYMDLSFFFLGLRIKTKHVICGRKNEVLMSSS